MRQHQNLPVRAMLGLAWAIAATCQTTSPAFAQSQLSSSIPFQRQTSPSPRIAQSGSPSEPSEDAEATQFRQQLEQEKLRLQQEKLELEAENIELQQSQLQLRRNIINQETQQLGLTENSKAIPANQAGSRFDSALQVIPIESKILVFQSSREIAQTIAQELIDLSEAPGSYGINAIVIYEPQEFSNVNSYRLYESLRQGLVSAYAAESIVLEEPTTPTPDGVRGGLDGAEVLQTSTTVLRSAAELLSYFRSEEVLYPNAFKPDGNGFLIAQLVSALRRADSPIQIFAPSVYLNSFSSSDNPTEVFLSHLDELAALRAKANQVMALSIDAQQAARLNSLNLQAAQLLNLLQFTESDRGKEGSERGGAQIFKLIQGAQISQLLNSEDKRVLVLDLLESGGSSRTRRSLFSTMFTGQKTSYSGGAAVQYFLVNPDNSLAAADVIYYNSGFKSMQRSQGN